MQLEDLHGKDSLLAEIVTIHSKKEQLHIKDVKVEPKLLEMT